MSQFDVALGMDHTTLDKGIGQLYSEASAREKLFKGTETGKEQGQAYTATWDLQQAPTFTLAPPSEERWVASIDANGTHPKAGGLPSSNVFQLVFPLLSAQYILGTAAPVAGTTEVIMIGQIKTEKSKLSIVPLAVWLDESRMSGWDKFILNKVILKQVLQQAGKALSGLQIPPLSFTLSDAKIELTSPQVSIVDDLLVVAASLESKGSVDISGVHWPKEPFFLLLSMGVMNKIVQGLASTIKNKEITYSDTWKGTPYSLKGLIQRVDNIGMLDANVIDAQVLLDFQATANLLGTPCSASAATSKF